MIETLITLPLLAFLLFAAVEYWGVLTIYQHAESLKYWALSRMEVEGGLPAEDRDELFARLMEIGADPDTIRITGDVLDGRDPVPWPGRVELRIEFVPEHFDGFTARVLLGQGPGEPVVIGVEGSAVSQKIAAE